MFCESTRLLVTTTPGRFPVVACTVCKATFLDGRDFRQRAALVWDPEPKLTAKQLPPGPNSVTI